MRKQFLCTASAVILGVIVAGPGSAADLAVKARPAARLVTPAPVFTWTGLYVGGNGGCAASTTSPSANITPADPPDPFTITGADSGGCYGGIQIGYNYQFGNWVAGI